MEPSFENIFSGFTRLELEKYQKYIYSIEHILNEEAMKYESSDIRSEQIHSFEMMSMFPQNHRKASLILLYGFFESRFTYFTDKLMTKNGSRLKLKDINGKGIERAKTALTKCAGWSINKCNNEWQTIINGYKVRNILVHNNGKIESHTSEKITKYINSAQYLEIDRQGYINIHAGYLLEITNSMIEFQTKLVDSNIIIEPT